MTQSFQEFLKKRPSWKILHKKTKKHEKVIFIRDLGEWAFSWFLSNDITIEERTFLYQIAFYCLGKKEIEKRLKGLK